MKMKLIEVKKKDKLMVRKKLYPKDSSTPPKGYKYKLKAFFNISPARFFVRIGVFRMAPAIDDLQSAFYN